MTTITTKQDIEAQLEKETNPSIREILQNHLKRFKDAPAPTTTAAPVEDVVVLKAPVEKKAKR